MTDTIALANDHAGLELKYTLAAFLNEQHINVENLGTDDANSCDYPDYAQALSAWVLSEPGRKGILICGSGIGMSIAANRMKGIRAALVRSAEEARLARAHNDANVLCLGSRITSAEIAKECVQQFLNAPFEGGRHQGRVEKMG